MEPRKFSLTADDAWQMETRLAGLQAGMVRTRLQAVLMYGKGQPIGEIRAQLGCSRSSVLKWCQVYRQSGLEGLLDQRRGGNNARLSSTQVEELFQRLSQTTPGEALGKASSSEGQQWTVKDLYRVVYQWYGVSYLSPSSYYSLLERYHAAGEGGEPGDK
jgi:transposase